jgi:vacuolar-type H+-ATPase subunit I/STV1
MKHLALLAGLAITNGDNTNKEDRTITKVVKLLQDMLDKSKAEGAQERDLYAKFKCYCDDNELEKKESIEDLTKEIGVLSSKIEELQGETGALSTECAKLAAAIEANEAARAEAETIRTQEHEEYVKAKADMEGAIAQMNEAIDTLAEVGADQTLGDSARDNKKFMAGFKGASLAFKGASLARGEVKEALIAASAFMTPAQHKVSNVFLQQPFTGSYSSQSGEIVGLLKNMRDTFRTNLATAKAAEKTAAEAYEKFRKVKLEEHTEMKDSLDLKQEKLGSNDDDLSAKKEQLQAATEQKASDEEFLEKLLDLCSVKAKEYSARKLARANEDAAIAEAISILNSDAAFASFGKTDATSTGATGPVKFIQLRSVQLHHPQALAQQVETVLSKSNSVRVKKIAAMVHKGNPFAEVLEQIEKMLKIIAEEGKVDKENLDWCNEERTENNENLDQKITQIETLDGEINELNTTINDPETGLKTQIQSTEESLSATVQAQKTETKDRMEVNAAYQTDIKNLVDAEELLVKAIKVLKKYYEALAKKIEEENAVLLQHREDPEPPETWGTFEGQSNKGNSAIEMLAFILKSTRTEEQEAHTEEEGAQHAYEDSMQALKDEEASLEKNLADLHKTLADKAEEHLMKQEELKKVIGEKVSIEEYLAKIKSGCDFITENYETRETNRKIERDALTQAVKLIQETPAYKTAMAEAREESFGDCKEPCLENEEHVKCKACMAKTSIPGFCAGHKGTEGCDTK